MLTGKIFRARKYRGHMNLMVVLLQRGNKRVKSIKFPQPHSYTIYCVMSSFQGDSVVDRKNYMHLGTTENVANLM